MRPTTPYRRPGDAAVPAATLMGGAVFRGAYIQSAHWLVAAIDTARGARLAVRRLPARAGVASWPLVRGIRQGFDLSGQGAGLWANEYAARDAEAGGREPQGAPVVTAAIERLPTAKPSMGVAVRWLLTMTVVLLVPQVIVALGVGAASSTLSLTSPGFQAWNAVASIVSLTAYMALLRRSSDIRTVFQMNAALLRALALHDRGEEVTLERLRREASFSPRSGFVYQALLAIVIAALVALVGLAGVNTLPASRTAQHFALVAMKLVLIPIAFGLTFEAQSLVDRIYRVRWARSFVRSVFFFGRAYVAEPVDRDLEVVESAVHELLERERSG